MVLSTRDAITPTCNRKQHQERRWVGPMRVGRDNRCRRLSVAQISQSNLEVTEVMQECRLSPRVPLIQVE